MIDLGENIIIIWKLNKSRSVAPAKLEIKLVSPDILFSWPLGSRKRDAVIDALSFYITKIYKKYKYKIEVKTNIPYSSLFSIKRLVIKIFILVGLCWIHDIYNKMKN